MKVTIKGYDDDAENSVTLSVYALDDVGIVGTVLVPDAENAAWLTSTQLRELAREVLALADRVDAANKALTTTTTTEGGAK